MFAGSGKAGDRVTLAVIAAVALLLAAVRTVWSSKGFLYSDDFGLVYRASTSPLDLEFLTQSYNGHVNPVGWAMAWFVQRAVPGSHLAISLVEGVLWAAIIFVTGWLAMRLTGVAPLAGLAMLVVGLTPLQWEASVWWSAAIYALPYQTFFVITLALLVHWQVTGADWAKWVSIATFTLTSLSFTRGPAALVLIFVLLAGLPWAGQEPRGFTRTWNDARPVWLANLGIGVTIAAANLARIPESDLPRANPADIVSAAWNLLVGNILPGLFGGPWRWAPVALPDGWAPVLAVPDAPRIAVWGCAVLTVVGLAVLFRKTPRLRFVLIGSIAWVVLVALLAATARAGNPLASMAYRYTYDAVWPGVFLVVVLASQAWRTSRTLLAGSVVALLLISSAYSLRNPATWWGENQGKLYVSNAAAGFDEFTGQTLLSQGVPRGLVDPLLLQPYANTRSVLGPQRNSPAFAQTSGEPMWGFAQDGRSERQTVSGVSVPAGPDAGCGYAITTQPRQIPLRGEIISWDFYARIAYFTQTAVTLNVAFGGEITSVPVTASDLTAVYFPVSGPGRDVLVSISEPGVTLCLTELTIGNRVGPDGSVISPPPGSPQP